MADVEKIELLYSLVGFPDETEWLEFKEGNSDPERIGRDISALANSAAYLGRDFAYRIWGVADGTHELVGTTFNPYTKKAKGNQGLLIWLPRFLSANASYEFDSFEHGGKSFVVLKIAAATGQPVSFDKALYIREGFSLLDVDAYYALLGDRKPEREESMLETLCEQELVFRQDNGRLRISNLGALLIGRDLRAFHGLGRRALRVVCYAGKGSFEIVEDKTFNEGYALSLPKAEEFIMTRTPKRELVDGAFRRIVHAYPQRAVRELLSNTVIHQDLSDMTEGPMVMLYENRIEFSNPGTTLIPVARLLNAPPKTRNTKLVNLMRQMDLCEEGGTGWDLTVASCEAVHMAAPKVQSEDGLGTRVMLLGGSAYEHMTKAERRDAVYWHACLMFAQGESMGNQSLRERFGLEENRKNMVAMSRLIKDCCEVGLIKSEDEEAGDKYRRYVPYWA